MKKCLLIPLLFALFSLSLTSTTFAQSQGSTKWELWDNQEPPGIVQKSEEDITNSDLTLAVTAMKGPYVDVKMKIVTKIKEVRQGKLSPEDFYKQVGEMKMPEGKEVRHVLMEIKKDIGNYLGKNGLRKVFGELYPSGGSQAESIILSHRKNVVMETIKQVMKDFAGEDLKFTVYYSEVGSWPNEGPKDMKFASDIDFNFLSGDLETAMRLKNAYDAYIVSRYHRTPEELDIPCTVNGMATGEVFVGKKGQGFAEKATKDAKKINFNDDGKGVRLEDVTFERALGNMLAEAKFSKIPLANLEELKWPTEPGISLEMIRHFEHDIVRQNVYTDLESFVKASKYTDRSFSALEADVKNGGVKNKLLRDLTKNLVEAKTSPKKQVELLEAYYKSKGKPLPFDAELDINSSGKTIATLKYNEKLIKEFWNDCRKTMWESANNKLRDIVTDFKKHAKSLKGKDSQEVKGLYEELNKYNEMMEVEDRVLTDDRAGLHEKMHPEYQKLLGEFRDVVKTFKQQAAKYDYLKVIDPTKSDTYKFIDQQLKLDNKYSIRMAAAAFAQAPGKVNDMLDFFDDYLMNRFRYGETKNFDQFLRSGKKAFWDDQADYFMGKSNTIKKYPGYLRQSKMKVTKISEDLTSEFSKSLASRGLKIIKGSGRSVMGGIQSVNNSFNRSVSASRYGGKLMTGMMVYNLYDELPTYYRFMEKDDWTGLAAEFFKRRVPFGSAVERGVMGDYYGVAWEITATMLPPVALASAAASIGDSLATTSIEMSLNEELQSFIDNLYEKAEFKLIGVERVGEDLKLSEWELVTVTVDGKTFNINELIAKETSDAREMEDSLKRVKKSKDELFPMEKVNDGLLGWKNQRAFEHKFEKTDAWIQLITEMEKNKYAGKDLKQYFRYKKYTRWAQIKVQFLKELKKELETRRAGEQSLVSGSFPKMYDELFTIADSLDIRPQIEESIANEFGGEVTQFVTSLKDYLRGTVREIKGDVDIWDVQEELSSFVTKYLRTYKRILEARNEAEKWLTFKREDQGLRILTGPYFLKGIFDKDVPESKKWSQYLLESSRKMEKNLVEIKKKLKMAPSTLDVGEGSREKDVLARLIYHDSFKKMWKQVHSHFTGIKVSSYLGKKPATQIDPNGPGLLSDQDRALQRFKFHDKRIKEILEQFKKDMEVKVAVQRVSHSLDELRIVKQKMMSLHSEVTALVNRINTIGKMLTKQTDQITKEINAFNTDQTITEDAVTIHDAYLNDLPDIDGLSLTIAEIRNSIEALSLKTCQLYPKIKTTDKIAELDDMIVAARRSSGETTAEFEKYTQNKKLLSQIKAKLKDIQKEFTKVKEHKQHLKRFKEMEAVITKITQQVQEVDHLMDGIQDKQSEAASLNSQAADILSAVKSLETDSVSDEDFRTIQNGLDLKEDIQKLVNKINQAESRLTEDSLFDQRQAKDLASRFNALQQPFLKDVSTQSGRSVDEARKDVQDALARIDAAELFYDAIAQAEKSAETCLKGSEDLYAKKTPYEKREAQADCSDFPGTKPKWLAQFNEVRCVCPDQDKRFNRQLNRCVTKQELAVAKADCQEFEGTHAVWHEGTQDVRCDCIDSNKKYSETFGRCISQQEFKVAQKDCSQWSNTEAVWSSSEKSAVCDCIDQYQWNRAHTFCFQKPDLQIKNANCSRWPYSEGIWNNTKERVECGCVGDYQWNKAGTACIEKPQLQVARTNCSKWPNSTPQWNPQKERVECDCVGDYEWNYPQNNACRIKKEIQVSNARCDQGLHPEWSDKSGEVRCFCDDGYWSSSENRCISEYEQELARQKRQREQEERDRQWREEQRRKEAREKAEKQRYCEESLVKLRDSVRNKAEQWQIIFNRQSAWNWDCPQEYIEKAEKGEDWRSSSTGSGSGGYSGGSSQGGSWGGASDWQGEVDPDDIPPEQCWGGILGTPGGCMSNAEYEKALREWRARRKNR